MRNRLRFEEEKKKGCRSTMVGWEEEGKGDCWIAGAAPIGRPRLRAKLPPFDYPPAPSRQEPSAASDLSIPYWAWA